MAKPSHVGADVDGLADALHQPTVHSCQRWGQGHLPGIVLSYGYSGRWCLSGDLKAPEHRYLMDG
jgi:hypothetical protein